MIHLSSVIIIIIMVIINKYTFLSREENTNRIGNIEHYITLCVCNSNEIRLGDDHRAIEHWVIYNKRKMNPRIV